MTLCPNCGANPCYHICPNSPHYYSAEQERADEPHYGDDDMRERYAGEIIDGELESRYAAMDDEVDAAAEEAWSASHPDDDDIHDSFRPNDDGTVTYISPSGGEHTYDPDQAFPREVADDDIPF